MDSDPVAKKQLGQHWLNDKASLEEMVEVADIKEGDTVLEVGPGPGSLTRLLIEKAEKVIAVEFDDKLAAELRQRVPADNLEVIQADILSYNLNDLPKRYKLATNLPYYLTGHFIRIISESANPPESAALLIQKEVAERLAAQPGEMSVIAVVTQYYWQVELGSIVNAGLFSPPPKVDSQIVSLKRRKKPLFDGVDTKLYFRIVKAGYSQKRKTLLNSLSSGLRLEKDKVSQALRSVGIDPRRRAQTLSLEEWHNLYLSIIT